MVTEDNSFGNMNHSNFVTCGVASHNFLEMSDRVPRRKWKPGSDTRISIILFTFIPFLLGIGGDKGSATSFREAEYAHMLKTILVIEELLDKRSKAW